MNELDMGDNVAWTESTGGAQLRWRWGSRSPSVDASATFRWPYGLWVLNSAPWACDGPTARPSRRPSAARYDAPSSDGAPPPTGRGATTLSVIEVHTSSIGRTRRMSHIFPKNFAGRLKVGEQAQARLTRAGLDSRAGVEREVRGQRPTQCRGHVRRLVDLTQWEPMPVCGHQAGDVRPHA